MRDRSMSKLLAGLGVYPLGLVFYVGGDLISLFGLLNLSFRIT